MAKEKQVILITGGSGFLGRALLRELLKKGKDAVLDIKEIRIFDKETPHWTKDKKVTYIPGDIRSYDDVFKACQGVDLIFNSAAVIDWGQRPKQVLHDINVKGTKNVLRAAIETGIEYLVHTSTMDVIYDGKELLDATEEVPYPEKHCMAYAETKAEAEQIVLNTNGTPLKGKKNTVLRTSAIRPCGMFGEADPYHVSNFIRLAEKGRLAYRVGDGSAIFQHAYVGNVAHGHILAAKSLMETKSKAAGNAYFITDFKPKNFFDYLTPIIQGLGYEMPQEKKNIPLPVMYTLAYIVEAATWLCRPFYRMAPAMTRTSVNMVCKSLTFSGEKAVRDLGYKPIYTEEEAIQNTIEYFKEHGPV